MKGQAWIRRVRLKLAAQLKEIAETFWTQLEEFANYCFNKSHAALLWFDRLLDGLFEGALSWRVYGSAYD